MLTFITESGGVYEVDSLERRYCKTATTDESLVPELDWTRYGSIQVRFDGGDWYRVESLDEIKPGAQVLFLGRDPYESCRTSPIVSINEGVAA